MIDDIDDFNGISFDAFYFSWKSLSNHFCFPLLQLTAKSEGCFKVYSVYRTGLDCLTSKAGRFLNRLRLLIYDFWKESSSNHVSETSCLIVF